MKKTDLQVKGHHPKGWTEIKEKSVLEYQYKIVAPNLVQHMYKIVVPLLCAAYMLHQIKG